MSFHIVGLGTKEMGRVLSVATIAQMLTNLTQLLISNNDQNDWLTEYKNILMSTKSASSIWVASKELIPAIIPD